MTTATLERPSKTRAGLRDAFSLDRRLSLAINPWKMRVRLSATQSIPSGGALVTIPFDTVDYDTTNSFNTATSQWTCPASGYYKMVGKANYSTGAGLKWALFLVRFYANGNRITEGVQVNAGDFTGTAGQILNTGYDTMTDDAPYINAGDVIDLRTTQQNSGGGAFTLNAGLFTYAVIHLLSG